MRPGVTDSSSASHSVDELLDKLDKFRVLQNIAQLQCKPIRKREISCSGRLDLNANPLAQYQAVYDFS
jgi:hypothetical protein